MALIFFQYTNAYDIHSADRLSELQCTAVMMSDGCYINTNDPMPVIEVMNEFGFTYEIVGL